MADEKKAVCKTARRAHSQKTAHDKRIGVKNCENMPTSKMDGP